ncbi:MAG: hypothetical protein ACK4V2_00420 [Pseudomonadota bacterium]|nr:hypothetical protein [Alphaproteobacteria bacterium]
MKRTIHKHLIITALLSMTLFQSISASHKDYNEENSRRTFCQLTKELEKKMKDRSDNTQKIQEELEHAAINFFINMPRKNRLIDEQSSATPALLQRLYTLLQQRLNL